MSASLLTEDYYYLLNQFFMITKGSKVRVLRKESYWYQDIGTVFKVEENLKYSVAVRFARYSYNSVNINNFSENELVFIS